MIKNAVIFCNVLCIWSYSISSKRSVAVLKKSVFILYWLVSLLFLLTWKKKPLQALSVLMLQETNSPDHLLLFCYNLFHAPWSSVNSLTHISLCSYIHYSNVSPSQSLSEGVTAMKSHSNKNLQLFSSQYLCVGQISVSVLLHCVQYTILLMLSGTLLWTSNTNK